MKLSESASMPKQDSLSTIRSQTIKDFGEKWHQYSGFTYQYLNNTEYLQDHFGDIFDVNEIKGKIILDIGAGCGNITAIMARLKTQKIYAIEPSSGGFHHLVNTIKQLDNADNIHPINARGEDFTIGEDQADLALTIGVINHIKNPQDVIKNIHLSLKKGGKVILWVYSYENNKGYIAFSSVLRFLTRYAPSSLLSHLSTFLSHICCFYIMLCRHYPLPLRRYINNVFSKCTKKERAIIIYDQIKPHYVKFYKREEVISLLEDAGFSEIKTYHRHGYSWTAVAEKA